MKRPVSHALCMALSTASIIAVATAGVAQAERQAAPIIYAGQEPTQPPKIMPSAPKAVSTPTVTPERRIQFRYPDQPLTSAVGNTVQSVATNTAPLSFSPTASATKTISVPSYAVTTAPTVLAGGFDAASASANVAPKVASAPAKPIRIASLNNQKPARTGKPLTLSRVNVNRDAPVGEEVGRAGIYVDGFDGQPTANGEIFDASAMTAAHPSLPLPSLVQVINEDNAREVVVRVNDRGPFDGKRILELSPRAGSVLGMSAQGAANVRVRYLGPAPVQQNKAAFGSAPVEAESLEPVVVADMPTPAPAPVLSTPDYGTPVFEEREPVKLMSVSAPVSLGNVYIQAGAFSDISNAQRLTAALGRGLDVQIEDARVNGGDYFRVLVGPFPSRDAAEVQRSQLSRAGIVEGFITTR